MEKITVFCPATIANVSCGFDVLGLCLDQVGDDMILERSSEPGVRIRSIAHQDLPLETEKNVAGVAASALLEHLGESDGVEIDIVKRIKPGSGIGSSAASAAGAVFGVNALFGYPLTPYELIPFAMEGEKLASGALHADNVAPALLGRFTLIRSYQPLEVLTLPTLPDLYAVVIHPQIELKTSDARSVLKEKVLLTQAITQWGNLAGLVRALYTNDTELLSRCLTDVIAEPLRSPLIPGFNLLKSAALSAGALGCGISGSGPSVFALCLGEKNAKEVSEAMSESYKSTRLAFDTHVCSINSTGIKIIPNCETPIS